MSEDRQYISPAEGTRKLRVEAAGSCRRCNGPMLWVRDEEPDQTWISATCPEHTDERETVDENEFLSLRQRVACPHCRQPMQIDRATAASRYEFLCSRCRRYVRLADLLPSRQDLIDGLFQ